MLHINHKKIQNNFDFTEFLLIFYLNIKEYPTKI